MNSLRRMRAPPEFQDVLRLRWRTMPIKAPLRCSLTTNALSRHDQHRGRRQTGWEKMDRRVRELAVLTGLSAVICGVAFASDYYIAATMFAALTCTTAVLAVVTRNFW
jgi:hypothetical protein